MKCIHNDKFVSLIKRGIMETGCFGSVALTPLFSWKLEHHRRRLNNAEDEGKAECIITFNESMLFMVGMVRKLPW